MSDEDRYWGWRWLDELEIRSREDAERVVADRRHFSDLALRAANAPTSSLKSLGERVVASWGLGHGLWQHGAQDAPERVNELLRRTWHYYDAIIVEDSLKHDFVHHARDPMEWRKPRLVNLITALLEIRASGADGMIFFTDKPKVCGEDWRHHAEHEQLRELIDGAEALIGRIVREAKTKTQSVAGFRELSVEHPLLRRPGRVRIVSKRPPKVLIREAVESALASDFSYLRSDLVTARHYDAPLALGDERAIHVLSGPASRAPLFELELPVLEDVPLAELLRMRRDLSDLFKDFQAALRRAASEFAARKEAPNPNEIALQVQRDLIDPEVRRIKSALDAARGTLVKKSIAGAALGTAAAGVGLLFGVPVAGAVLAAVAAGAAGGNAAIGKYFDTRDEVRRSNLYFLWRVVTEAKRVGRRK